MWKLSLHIFRSVAKWRPLSAGNVSYFQCENFHCTFFMYIEPHNPIMLATELIVCFSPEPLGNVCLFPRRKEKVATANDAMEEKGGMRQCMKHFLTGAAISNYACFVSTRTTELRTAKLGPPFCILLFTVLLFCADEKHCNSLPMWTFANSSYVPIHLGPLSCVSLQETTPHYYC